MFAVPAQAASHAPVHHTSHAVKAKAHKAPAKAHKAVKAPAKAKAKAQPVVKGRSTGKVYPVPSHSEGPFGCVNLPLVYGSDGRLVDTTGQFTREGTAYHLNMRYVGAVTRVAGSLWSAVKPSENFCNVTFLYLSK
jgi:hypothetical protein